jgi:hypothetical protein
VAIIQMLNDEVLDVQEDGRRVAAEIARSGSVVQLTIIEEHGGGKIWVNPRAISSLICAPRNEPEPVLDQAV